MSWTDYTKGNNPFQTVIHWFPLKDTIKKMNWQTTDWEIFALHIPDIKFESRIYTELL